MPQTQPQPGDVRKGFDLKQLEYQSVLDLTIAINKNNAERGLFIVFEDYLLEKLGMDHFSVYFKEEEEWSTAFCYGRVVSGWKGISSLENEENAGLLRDTLPDLQRLNPHVHYAIPFRFDSQLRGIVLCGMPVNFPHPFRSEAIALIETLMSLMVMAQENQKLLAYRIRQEALRREVEIARQVQRMLFPKSLPEEGRLRIYTTYMPHMDVSGDYYDFIPLSGDAFAFCVADVSGKGMSAALLMSNFQACLRTLMMEKKELREAVQTLNTIICQNSNMERFITAFIGVLDFGRGLLTYVNAGHNPPCMVFEDGRVEQLPLGTTILGIFPRLPHLVIGEVQIRDPFLLALYTDGLTEIENEHGDEFGPEGLEKYFRDNRNEKLPVLHQRLLNRLDIFAGRRGFNDDITLFTAHVKP